MSLRISSVLLVAGLAACSAQSDSVAASNETMSCALDGAADFSPVCTVERKVVPGGTNLVVRQPEGGFRRFEVEGDLVRTADGAEPTKVTVHPDATEVAIGDDRYRLPPPAPPVDAARR